MTDRNNAVGPICPFCSAPWSAEMLDQFDRFTVPSGCACCGGDPAVHAAPAPAIPLPAEDLCCATCGRAIYRAPDRDSHEKH